MGEKVNRIFLQLRFKYNTLKKMDTRVIKRDIRTSYRIKNVIILLKNNVRFYGRPSKGHTHVLILIVL